MSLGGKGGSAKLKARVNIGKNSMETKNIAVDLDFTKKPS
jgi:hypothetical protein